MRSPATHGGDPARRAGSRWLLAALVAALSILPVPARAAGTAGPCVQGQGITVVVDYRSLGGDTVVRCAPFPVESGYDALTRVGLDWTPTRTHPGFLCRIEGVPADDPCVRPSPAHHYWSYWRAQPGGTWQYSQYGPATTSPPPGPVEGWSFVAGAEARPPRIPPPEHAAPAEPSETPSSAPPAPEPTSEQPTRPTAPAEPATDGSTVVDRPSDGPQPSAPASASAEPTPGPVSRSPVPVEPSPTAGPDPTTPADPTATPTPEATTPSDDPSSPRGSTTTPTVAAGSGGAGGGGPPVGTIVGAGLVVAVGAGALSTARKRRAGP